MTQVFRKIPKKAFAGILAPLLETPEPPEELYVEGILPTLSPKTKVLTVIGSRRNTTYGRVACQTLLSGLSGYPIIIVSGLALGIDGTAHESALKAGLPTIAFPGSGLSEKVLYPSAHKKLAKEILEKGGALLSEFEPEFEATPWSFPKRNRLMAGIAHAVLVIEAEQKSGTLITARLALDYNKTVLAVPGAIGNETATGTNALIREGATPILESKHILEALGIPIEEKNEEKELYAKNLSEEEKSIMDLLREPKPKEDIVSGSNLPVTETLMALSKLEMKGLIVEEYGVFKKK